VVLKRRQIGVMEIPCPLPGFSPASGGAVAGGWQEKSLSSFPALRFTA